jgi:hypothetical protein
MAIHKWSITFLICLGCHMVLGKKHLYDLGLGCHMLLTFMCKLLKPGLWQQGNEENNLYLKNEICVVRYVFDDNDKNEKNHEIYNCKW